jgi:cytochrome c oxidase accessory protein FixG
MAAHDKVIPLTAVPPDRQGSHDQDLYEVRKKIYPRAVTGAFARWRWALVFITQLVFYGAPWLTWNERQAVLFDLAARKFYIFGLVFWPQDFIYLTGLLIISAFSLFLFTAVAGRLWCGYACPQTVYTEIFLWIERKIEGEHLARMKLDSAPLTARKFSLKAIKHGVWIALAFWTGFTFVGYFTPIKVLGGEFFTFTLGAWEAFWILFYGFATYGNAGWLREQVCIYMCPYARFQGVMFDRDTLLITYDQTRGDPRGSRSKKADYKSQGLGDCVDCDICVQVCPTGIDIRNGQQYECIGCAACIDGCDQVMDKMGYPRGLIRYSTLNAVDQHFGWRDMLKRIFRPRVLAYTAILWLIIAAASVTLYLRVPIKVDVIRDRASLARAVEDGKIENVYRLQIMNTEEKAHRFTIAVHGSHDLEHLEVLTEPQPLQIGPSSSRVVPVRVRAEPEHGHAGLQRIDFIIEASDDEEHLLPEIFSIREKSSFFVPGASH